MQNIQICLLDKELNIEAPDGVALSLEDWTTYNGGVYLRLGFNGGSANVVLAYFLKDPHGSGVLMVTPAAPHNKRVRINGQTCIYSVSYPIKRDAKWKIRKAMRGWKLEIEQCSYEVGELG